MTDEIKADWGRTVALQVRISDHEGFEPPNGDPDAPQGRFKGRPIIGSGMTRIIGGIYPGKHGREAIVVDDRVGVLDEAFDRFRKGWWSGLLSLRQPDMITAVMRWVTTEMRYDDRGVEKVLDEYAARDPDRKISLGCFVTAHVGVCRHMALLAGYALERLMKGERMVPTLRGTFSLERNTLKVKQYSIGAHVWIRFTDPSGIVTIMDPARKIVAPLNTLCDLESGWQYARPSDR